MTGTPGKRRSQF